MVKHSINACNYLLLTSQRLVLRISWSRRAEAMATLARLQAQSTSVAHQYYYRNSRVDERLLVLQPGIRAVPLRWESQLQNTGPQETS